MYSGFRFSIILLLWLKEVILVGVCLTKYPMASQTYFSSSQLVAGNRTGMIMFVMYNTNKVPSYII